MSTATETLTICPDVHWVGILDFNIKNFDIVMETKYGTTYNSYLVLGDKKALIETAKVTFWDEYLTKIKSLTDPSEIDYIILNHTEPDHSGSAGRLLELAPQATVVGSANTIKYLEEVIGRTFAHIKVKDGDTLSLGNKTLRFINAPNLHWPDSTYTYLEEDQILFTCDSFGAHYAHRAMFDDECPNYDDAFLYYYNAILRPFSKFFLQAIERIRPLAIRCICPGHGPILRQWQKRVDESETLSKAYLTVMQTNRILVAYVSAYGYTKEAAERIASALQSLGGLEVDLCDVEFISAGELSQKIEQAHAYIIGSPTINQNTLPQIYQIFACMTPLRDRQKMAAAFGSYGWSGEAVGIIESGLRALKLNVFEDHHLFKFRPLGEKGELAYEFGLRFGQAFKESLENPCQS